jgi:transposase
MGSKPCRCPGRESTRVSPNSFEIFAIDVILASRSLKDAGDLLRLGWHPLHSIMKRAVDRGLERRGNDEIAWVGMDEKSFRKGHNYISLINDLEEVRVLDLLEGREGLAADSLIEKALDEGQREMVCGVAIDMSAPFIRAIRRHLPHADIVHDKFHIAKHLNEAVDKTRRKEHRKLLKNKNDRLTGTKFSWLKGMEHLSDESLAQVESLAKAELDVAKAWYIKELFRHFWTRRDAGFAESFFERWHKEAFATGFRNVRAKLRRVSRWRPETQMVPRWLAYSLLEAERGFRRVNGFEDMAKLAKILESISPPPPEEGEKALPSRSRLDPEPSTEYKP